LVAELLLPLRLAWRFSRRALGQAFLVVALIAVPVATAATVLTVFESRVASVDEVISMRVGQSGAQLIVVSPPDPSLTQNPIDPDVWRVDVDPLTGRRANSSPSDPRVALVAALPAGTRLIPISDKGVLVVKTASGIGAVRYVEGEVWDPALEGAYQLTAGRAPREPSEVMVTESTLLRLGVMIGGELTATDPSRSFTIVGTVDDVIEADSVNVVFAVPGTLPGSGATRYFAPDLSPSWEEIQDLNAEGVVVWSRQVLLAPPSGVGYLYSGEQGSGAALTLIGIFGVFEVSVLAGAAFLIGARRQQRHLAILTSSGAPRAALIRIITSQGAVQGAVGGAVGAVVGVLTAWIIVAITDSGDAREFPGFHVPWAALMAVVGVALLSGWLAALLPAIVASRFDVIAALRGATRPPRPKRHYARAGTVWVVAGGMTTIICTVILSATDWGFLSDVTDVENALIVVMIAAIALASLALAIGTLLLIGPLLTKAALWLTNAPLPLRVAVRDMARDSSRSVPTIAVILSTVAVATFVLTTVAYADAVQSTYRVLPTAVGQATVRVFSSATFEGEPTLSVSEANSISEELTTVLRGRLDADDVRVFRGPDQDWAAWASGDPATLVRPLVDAAKACPLDELGSAVDPRDTRCDLRNDLIHLGATGPGAPNLLVGSWSDLELLAGTAVPDSLRELLEDGGAVSFWPQLIDGNGDVTIGWESLERGKQPTIVHSETLEGGLITNDDRLAYGVFITPETARGLGVELIDAFVLADLRTSPSETTIDAVNAEVASVFPGAPFLEVTTDPAEEGDTFRWLIVGAVCAATASAGGVAVSLTRINGRRARFTFWSIGAAPATMRLASGIETGIQTALAVVFGIIVGMVPGLAIWGFSTTGIETVPPLPQLGLLLLGLPTAFGIASALASPGRAADLRPDEAIPAG
jgi:hypothetical protein